MRGSENERCCRCSICRMSVWRVAALASGPDGFALSWGPLASTRLSIFSVLLIASCRTAEGKRSLYARVTKVR